MGSLFTKIISGEIPCHKIDETENCLAFLDIRPVKRGHTLVIPKKEVDYYFDLEDGLMAELAAFSKRVAGAVRKAIPCKRVGVMIAGLEVPHAHIHLIPIDEVRDLNFANAKECSQEDLGKTAEEIRGCL